MSFGNFNSYQNIPPPQPFGTDLSSLSASFRQQNNNLQPTSTTSPEDFSPVTSGSGDTSKANGNTLNGNGNGNGAKKKRVRASTGAAGNASDEDESDGDDADGKRRRSRQALSCASCKKRKIKCDRKIPCMACIKRNVPDQCSWDEAKINPTPQPFALAEDMRHLASRLAQVEAFLQTLPPELREGAPKPQSVKGSARLTLTRADVASRERATSVGQADEGSDTEQAAIELEASTFGGVSMIAGLGSAHASTRMTTFAVDHVAHSLSCPRSVEVPVFMNQTTAERTEPTQALTSIVAPPINFNGGFSTSVRMGLDFGLNAEETIAARNAAILKVFSVLPTKEQSYVLVDGYFTKFDWIHHVVNQVCFKAELERFWEMCERNRQTEVDPLWIAQYCMILALSLEGLQSNPKLRDSPERQKVLSEIKYPVDCWYASSQRCLQLGDCAGAPSIRGIVTILLVGQFTQIQGGGGSASRFLSLFAGAVRAAQILGLDRLGSDDEIMPPEDPAFPPGKNSIKRQIALRIFNCLVFMDCLTATPRFPVYLLNPQQYTSACISNVNDADLSLTDWRIKPLPSSMVTDSSFEVMKYHLATQSRNVFDNLVSGKSASNFSYETVLELDRGYRAILDELPDIWKIEHSAREIKDPYLRWRRHVCHEGLHSRLVRLHRPFLTRGYQPNSKFRYSMEQCVASAKVVIASHHNIVDTSFNVWFVFNHALGSAIVLFCDLFHAIDADCTDGEIEHKKETLVLAFEIFGRWEEIINPVLRTVVHQGARVLSALFMAEEMRRVTRMSRSSSQNAAPVESFAQILTRITRELDLKPSQAPLAERTAPATTSSTIPDVDFSVDFSQMDMLPPGFFQDLGLPTVHNNNVDTWALPSGVTPPDFTFLAGAAPPWNPGASNGSMNGGDADANALAASALLEQLTSEW